MLWWWWWSCRQIDRGFNEGDSGVCDLIDTDQKVWFHWWQVGPGDGYVLTVGGFNDALSTLGDSMAYSNGAKFGTKWVDDVKSTLPHQKCQSLFLRDRDTGSSSNYNCAVKWSGGWWYNYCHHAHPTGTNSATQVTGHQYIVYWHESKSKYRYNLSWEEAEYLLVPNWTKRLSSLYASYCGQMSQKHAN